MPARVSLQDMQQVVDPATTFDWAVWLPSVPGGPYNTRDFTFRCQAAEIPQLEQEPIKVEAHGLQFNYPGRRIWSGTIALTLFETRDGVAADLLEKWLDHCRNIRNSTGNYRSAYAVDAELNLYDAPGNITKRIKLERFYPLTLGQGTLDNSSTLLTYACTFSFDRTSPMEL